MFCTSPAVALIRRRDVVCDILTLLFEEEGLEVKRYTPPVDPRRLVLDERPRCVIYHAPRGEEFRAIAFLQILLLRRLPRTPILLHADDLNKFHPGRLRAAGVELIGTDLPVAEILKRGLRCAGLRRSLPPA